MKLISFFLITLLSTISFAEDHGAAELTTHEDPNVAAIQRAYRAFLGRTGGEEIAVHLNAIRAGTSLATVLRSIVASPEADAHALTVEPAKSCEEKGLQNDILRGLSGATKKKTLFSCGAFCKATKKKEHWRVDSKGNVQKDDILWLYGTGRTQDDAWESLQGLCQSWAYKLQRSDPRLQFRDGRPAAIDASCAQEIL